MSANVNRLFRLSIRSFWLNVELKCPLDIIRNFLLSLNSKGQESVRSRMSLTCVLSLSVNSPYSPLNRSRETVVGDGVFNRNIYVFVYSFNKWRWPHNIILQPRNHVFIRQNYAFRGKKISHSDTDELTIDHSLCPLFAKPDNHVTIWEFVQDICS